MHILSYNRWSTRGPAEYAPLFVELRIKMAHTQSTKKHYGFVKNIHFSTQEQQHCEWWVPSNLQACFPTASFERRQLLTISPLPNALKASRRRRNSQTFSFSHRHISARTHICPSSLWFTSTKPSSPNIRHYKTNALHRRDEHVAASNAISSNPDGKGQVTLSLLSNRSERSTTIMANT